MTRTMRPAARCVLAALMTTAALAIAAPGASAATAYNAYLVSASVVGSSSMTTDTGTVSASVNFTISSTANGPDGEYTLASGAKVYGRATGTASITISPKDAPACSTTATIDPTGGVEYGGLDQWVAFFGFDQVKPSDQYPCFTGALDILTVVHGTMTACGGSSPAIRARAEANVPLLTIENVEASACGSITERATIVHVPVDTGTVTSPTVPCAGRVEAVSGTGGKLAGGRLARGMVVEPGESITTGRATVRVRLSDGTEVTIKPGSTFTMPTGDCARLRLAPRHRIGAGAARLNGPPRLAGTASTGIGKAGVRLDKRAVADVSLRLGITTIRGVSGTTWVRVGRTTRTIVAGGCTKVTAAGAFARC